MPLVSTCAEADFDVATGTCANPVWMYQPALLPPLPADQGLVIAGAMIAACASAWGLKAVRRFIWPRA